MRPIPEQTVLVTGATDGLGKAVATELARAGATVCVHGRDDDRGKATLAEITAVTGNDRVRWYRADLAHLDQVRELATAVTADIPRLDALISNAGIGTLSPAGGRQAYCQSKLAQIMLTYDLAEELAGTGVTATALHPATHMPTKIVATPVSTLQSGVDATLRLVLSRALDGVSGRYYNGQRQVRAHPQAYDRAARARLRTLSEQLTGLAPAGAPARSS